MPSYILSYNQNQESKLSHFRKGMWYTEYLYYALYLSVF